ncbi:MAG TPA: hypothetical protein DD412_05355 [Holosporales bacterium]|nr:hypothetical protein [Holosporales bacterium]
MVTFKTLFARNVNQALFVFLVLASLFVAAALSLIPVPIFFKGPPLFVHFYAVICFAALLYLPAWFWFCFLLPSLWLDLMLETFLGFHAVLILLQQGAISLMKKFLKGYGFLSHWAVFSFSYVVIFTFLDAFSLSQSALTILAYPLLFNGIIMFFSRFRWMIYG